MYLSKIYLALLMFIYVSVQNAGGDEPLRVRKEQSKRESLVFPEKSLIEYGSTRWRTYRNVKGIDAVLFSSDGKFYVTFSRNKALHVFELLTGKSVQLIDDGLDLLPVAISHNNRLLAYRKRNKLYMFDLLERQILWSINLPDQKIKGSFSPADQVFIVSQQLCATLYDPIKGRRVREYQIANKEKGFVMLSGCTDLVGKVHASGKVECWDVESGKLRRKLENIPSTNVKFHSPDGKSITIYGLRENSFFVLHPNNKIQTCDLPEESSSVWTEFLHKTNTLVSVSQGGDVLCFDLEKRELREKISSAYLIHRCFFSPKKEWLVIVFENEICCYSLPTFRQVKLHAPSIKSDILNIQIVADEKLLIVRDRETLRVWDTRTGKCLNSLVGHSSDVKSLAVSEFNNIVMSSARFDRSVQLWNAENGSHLETVEYPLEYVSEVAISPDGSRVAIMGLEFLKGSRTFVHDVRKGERIGYVDTRINRFGKGHCQGLRLAFCDRGEILFLPHIRDYVAFFYDIKSKKKWQENLPEWCGIEDFAVSPIGNWISMHVKPNYKYEMDKRYSELTLVYKLENKSLRLVHQLPFGGKITFSRDGKLMAICDNKNVVRLVETMSGEVIERKTSKSKYLRVLPNHNLIELCNPESKELYFRDFSTQERLSKVYELSGDIKVLDWSPDGRNIFFSKNDLSFFSIPTKSIVSFPKVQSKSQESIEGLWEKMGHLGGYEAVKILASKGDESIKFLETKLLGETTPKYQELIHRLESRQFKIREMAQKELKELGWEVEAAYVQSLNGKISLEGRVRVEKLLGELYSLPLSRQALQRYRAVTVLELIRSKESLRILQRVASTHGSQLLKEAALDSIYGRESENSRPK